jgi:hypothetical protein
MNEQFTIVHKSQPDLQNIVCHYVSVTIDGQEVSMFGIDAASDADENAIITQAQHRYSVQQENLNQ